MNVDGNVTKEMGFVFARGEDTMRLGVCKVCVCVCG